MTKVPPPAPLPGDVTEDYVDKQVDNCNRLAGLLVETLKKFVADTPGADDVAVATGVGLLVDRLEDLYPVSALVLARQIARTYKDVKPEDLGPGLLKDRKLH